MVDRDVVQARLGTIERCLGRIEAMERRRSALHADGGPADAKPAGDGLSAVDIDDIVTLNLQRATQAAIDLAAHVVASEGYGMPARPTESFPLLAERGLIDEPLCRRLQAMVGFRNIAVHQYQELDPEIVRGIVRDHLGDLRSLGRAIVRHFELADS